MRNAIYKTLSVRSQYTKFDETTMSRKRNELRFFTINFFDLPCQRFEFRTAVKNFIRSLPTNPTQRIEVPIGVTKKNGERKLSLQKRTYTRTERAVNAALTHKHTKYYITVPLFASHHQFGFLNAIRLWIWRLRFPNYILCCVNTNVDRTRDGYAGLAPEYALRAAR